MAMETEEIGQNVLNNLAQDREKINNARNRLLIHILIYVISMIFNLESLSTDPLRDLPRVD